MGMFAGTCSLTNLPIEEKTPTRLVLLQPAVSFASRQDFRHLSGVCMSWDLFEPFGLPLKGRYDSYGRIIKIERDLNVQFIEQFFKDSYQNGKLILDEFTKKTIDIKFDIDSILSIISQGGFQLKEREEEKECVRPFGFMLILESAFQMMLKVMSGPVRDKRDGKVEKGGSVYKAFAKQAKEFTTRLREWAEYDSPERQAELKRILDKEHPELYERTLKYNELSNYSITPFGITSVFNKFLNETCREMLKVEAKKDPKSPLLASFFNLEAEYYGFLWFMNFTRKVLGPQSGCGSQSEDTYYNQKLAEFILSEIE